MHLLFRILRGFCQGNVKGQVRAKIIYFLTNLSFERVRLVTGTLLRPGNWEDRGHITHELLHALGHHHTQNRPDRNEHIAVHLDNVLDPSQYERCTDCKVFGTDYDCMSIMHYRWNSLAVDRSEPTMSPLPGQNCDLRSRNRSFPSIRAYINNMRQQVSYLVRY